MAREIGTIDMAGHVRLHEDNPPLLAELVARQAHRHQVDKLDRPYIEHVARVAAGVHSPDEKTVAWLHDVVEDTDVSLDDLRAQGFTAGVVEAVNAITHRPHEPRTDYYARVRANPLARAVKLADVADNSDPSRLTLLDDATRARLERKYAAAREALTVEENQS